MTVAYLEPRAEFRRRAGEMVARPDPELPAAQARIIAYLDPDTGPGSVTAAVLHCEVDPSISVDRWSRILAHLALARPGPDPRTVLDPLSGTDPVAYALGPRGWATARRIALPAWPAATRARTRHTATLEPNRWESTPGFPGRDRYLTALRIFTARHPQPTTAVDLHKALGEDRTQAYWRRTCELMASDSVDTTTGLVVDHALLTGWPTAGPAEVATPWTLTPAGHAAAERTLR